MGFAQLKDTLRCPSKGRSQSLLLCPAVAFLEPFCILTFLRPTAFCQTSLKQADLCRHSGTDRINTTSLGNKRAQVKRPAQRLPGWQTLGESLWCRR